MKNLKKGIKLIVVLLILIVIGLWGFAVYLKPVYQGNLELASIENEVTVYYDDHGVPHINAKDQHDAYVALGYVHAQDRLWQMELIRRIAAGRLSELFGEKVLPTDKFFTGLGIEEAATETIENLDKNSEAYKLSMAYLNGVNQFIKNGKTPVEYYLLGVDKEEFQLKDIYNVYGFMSFSFAMAHKTDPLLTNLKKNLGAAYLKDLGISVDPESTLIHNFKEENAIESALTSSVTALFEKLPVSPFIGSNSWVIAPERTKNKKVIFANDPHIGFAQPSVWYQAHVTTPNYEIYGYHLALTPFPLLGHNRNYAYGLTMFENDDIDFYTEENNPKNEMEYKTPEGYKKYKIRNKKIMIKGADPVSFQVKVSKHGPVMNDLVAQIDTEQPVAMDWVYTKFENKMLEASYKISHASSKESFEQGVQLIHAPGLNVMYGDAKDNVAWWAAGKLYKHKNGAETKLILNGTEGEDDQVEYLDFSQNPQAVNPPWNYVYSANNQPDSIAGMLYPGYYLPEDRAKRIVQLLKAKNDFTKEDVAKMIYDVTSAETPAIVQDIVQGVALDGLSENKLKTLDILVEWDGTYGLKNVAPTIYTKLYYHVLKAVFEDEMGEKGFEQFLNTHLQKRVIALIMANENSIWWDNVGTEDHKENRKEIITNAFHQSVLELEDQLGKDISKWTWNKVHTVEYKHPMGEVALLRKMFNVGPFEAIGSNEVINNQLFDINGTGEYKVKAGPSTRRIIDFSDVENSLGILPTGQSGNIFSKHYKDQAEKFLKGEFVPMLLNQEVIQQSKDKLVFSVKE